jgi:AraC-like DNA-binding protein
MSGKNIFFDLKNIARIPGSQLQVVQTGRVTSSSGVHYSIGGYYCWHIIASGKGFLKAGGNVFSPAPGDMFTLQPGIELEYWDDPGEPWDFYWLHFTGSGAEELSKMAGFSADSPWKRSGNGQKILKAFHAIWTAAGQICNHTPQRMASLLFNVIDAVISDKISEPQERSAKSLAETAAALLEEPLHSNINVNELAASMLVSRATLFRAFREHFGISPGKYLRLHKLQRAAAILQNTPGITVEKAAAAAGFDNVKYFYKAFAAARGMTPGSFKTLASVRDDAEIESGQIPLS